MLAAGLRLALYVNAHFTPDPYPCSLFLVITPQAKTYERELDAARELARTALSPALEATKCVLYADWENENAWTLMGATGPMQRTLKGVGDHIQVRERDKSIRSVMLAC